MAKGVRAIVAAAALGMGLLGAAGAARANEYDFTFVQPIGSYDYQYFSVYGTFNLNGSNITSANAVLTEYNTPYSSAGTIFLSYLYSGSIANNSLRLSIGDVPTYSNANKSIFLAGTVSNTVDGYTGNIQAYLFDNYEVYPEKGIFDAVSASPTASSGSAPSPEVNTLLGFLVVGGTVAFLKRRRRGAGAEGMAAA